MTLYEYLRREYEPHIGKIDFRFRVTELTPEGARFYVHPLRVSGDTRNLIARPDGSVVPDPTILRTDDEGPE